MSPSQVYFDTTDHLKPLSEFLGSSYYNFEVEGTHTYFVGKTGAWVHNDCLRPPWATPGDPNKFAAWMQQIQKARTVLTSDEADAIVQEARSYGMDIRALPEDLAGAHSPANPWTGTPHIHIGAGQTHLNL